MIPPRADLDDEGTRLLTYKRAHAASVERLDALGSLSASIGATVSGVPAVQSDIDSAVRNQVDDLAGDPAYHAARAARAALSGVVQQSLRDFLS